MMQAWRIMATVLYLSGGLHASTGAKVLGIGFIGEHLHMLVLLACEGHWPFWASTSPIRVR